jgi:hypothetical protein
VFFVYNNLGRGKRIPVGFGSFYVGEGAVKIEVYWSPMVISAGPLNNQKQPQLKKKTIHRKTFNLDILVTYSIIINLFTINDLKKYLKPKLQIIADLAPKDSINPC